MTTAEQIEAVTIALLLAHEVNDRSAIKRLTVKARQLLRQRQQAKRAAQRGGIRRVANRAGTYH
jgi:hypothetical protein